MFDSPFLKMMTQYRYTLDNCDLITSDLSHLVESAIAYGRFLERAL